MKRTWWARKLKYHLVPSVFFMAQASRFRFVKKRQGLALARKTKWPIKAPSGG
jgi:hypothetical protein